MALTKKSATTIPHGLGSEATAAKTATGLITITNAEVGAELTINVMIKDESADFVGHLVGDTKTSIKLDGHTTALNRPTLWAEVTFGGRKGAIVGTTITASNEDFVKASVSAEGYDATGSGPYA
jgi:hypothetical protein